MCRGTGRTGNIEETRAYKQPGYWGQCQRETHRWSRDIYTSGCIIDQSYEICMKRGFLCSTSCPPHKSPYFEGADRRSKMTVWLWKCSKFFILIKPFECCLKTTGQRWILAYFNAISRTGWRSEKCDESGAHLDRSIQWSQSRTKLLMWL